MIVFGLLVDWWLYHIYKCGLNNIVLNINSSVFGQLYSTFSCIYNLLLFNHCQPSSWGQPVTQHMPAVHVVSTSPTQSALSRPASASVSVSPGLSASERQHAGNVKLLCYLICC